MDFKPIYKVASFIDLEELKLYDTIKFWYMLSSNPNAIHLLEQNLDKVDWRTLPSNPNAIPILEQHLDKVDWRALSNKKNKHLLSLIENNYNLLTMDNKIMLLIYPCIFTLDTKAMMDQCKPFCEELCKYVFSPRRVIRSLDLFNYNIVGDDIWDV